MTIKIDNQFYAKIRLALGHEPGRRRPWADLGRVQRTKASAGRSGREEHSALLATLQERSKINGMPVTVCSDAARAARVVAGIVRQNLAQEGGPAHVVTWKHAVIDGLDLESVLATEAPQITVYPADGIDPSAGASERQRAKDLAATAVCGVTSADWCLAESATLVLRTRPGQWRSVSLMPPVHIAVITQASIISDLGELFTTLQADSKAGYHGLTNCMTFVSGRSTTRDIESVAVPGAHGPKAVHIVVVTG